MVGNTSRGLFLLLAGEQVVFLSFEHWRGPLTLNIDTPQPWLRTVTPGALAAVQPGRLCFEPPNGIVQFQQAVRWSADPLPAALLPPEQRRERLMSLAQMTAADKGGAGFAPLLLPFLRHTPAPEDAAEVNAPALLQTLTALQTTLRQADLDATVRLLTPYMGLGRGLTPSGDDLIAGVLLAANRLPESVTNIPAALLPDLNARLSTLATRKTTRISANLLQAAAQGQADERLIQALHAVIANGLPLARAAHDLTTWGNSSGADALLGMTVVLST